MRRRVKCCVLAKRWYPQKPIAYQRHSCTITHEANCWKQQRQHNQVHYVFSHKCAQCRYASINDIIAIVQEVPSFKYSWFQPSLQLDRFWEPDKQHKRTSISASAHSLANKNGARVPSLFLKGAFRKHFSAWSEVAFNLKSLTPFLGS